MFTSTVPTDVRSHEAEEPLPVRAANSLETLVPAVNSSVWQTPESVAVGAMNRPLALAHRRPALVHATSGPVRTLDDAIRAITTHESRLHSDFVDVDDLRIEGDRLFAGEQEFVLRPGSFARLCAWLHAPSDYIAGLPQSLRDQLLDYALRNGHFSDPKIPRNRRFAKAISRCRLMSRDRVFVDFDRADLTSLDGATVLQAVREGIGEGVSDLELHRFAVSDEGFQLDLVSPRVAEEVRPGDIIRGGVQVQHSLLGEQTTSVEAFVLRLTCLNGAVAHVCLGKDGKHGARHTRRIRRLANTSPMASRLHCEQVRRLAAERFGQLRQHLDQVLALAGRGSVDVARVLEAVLRQARMASEKLRKVLIERAWRQEQHSESTYFGALNAITWLASHAEELDTEEWYRPSESQVRSLQRLAGTFLTHGAERCPHCYSVLWSRN